MRELGLVPCQSRPERFGLTQAAAGMVPDLGGRDFTSVAPGGESVGDITYIATGEGWLYLTTVIDCCTKEVIGYAMRPSLPGPLSCLTTAATPEGAVVALLEDGEVRVRRLDGLGVTSGWAPSLAAAGRDERVGLDVLHGLAVRAASEHGVWHVVGDDRGPAAVG
jgi:hypothetical protein